MATVVRTREDQGPALIRWLGRDIKGPLVFLGVNALAGLLMDTSSLLATAHFGVVVLVCGWSVLVSRRPEVAVLAAAYVAGCDVLWRMTDARAPWEAGKYGVIAVLGIALARYVRSYRGAGIPVAFVLLLLPSGLITLNALGLMGGRDQLAFHLAGPITLGVSVIFFRQVVAREQEATTILWVLLGPVAAIATIATRATVSAEDLVFTTESNFVTSGGYGPNQVSTILGFGALMCVLLVLRHIPWRTRAFTLALGAWLVVQALLTFSRGGVYALVVAAAAIGLAGLGSSGGRSRVLVGLVAGFLVLTMAYSFVDDFSHGALEVRYSEDDSTGRDELISSDLENFYDSPVWGVGPGLTRRDEALSPGLEAATAHTEYSRLLSEHGLFGLVAILLLVTMAVQAYRQSLGKWNHLLAAGMAGWVLADLAHSATRIALVGFVFGLANLRVAEDG